MLKYFFIFLILISNNGYAQIIDVTSFGAMPNSFADATGSIQKALEASSKQRHSVINFPKGRYDFWPDSAVQTHYYISNSSSELEIPIKKQKVGLLLKGLKNVTIEGNGSLFVFHGKMITWVIDSSENINIRDVVVNYERPGMSEMTLTNITPTAITARIHPDSKFAIINDHLEWYGENWVARNYHAALVTPAQGTVFYSNWEPFHKSKAEIIAPLTVKFAGDFTKFKADTGDVLTIRDRYRDYVGAFHNRSKNIALHNVHMYSMHGLGIVSQFSENLNYDSVSIAPQTDGGRVISSSADGMHFSGCKGQITINRCHFKGLHDDPVNVHGTHLIVKEVVNQTTLRLRFMHHQSYGFVAFVTGDSIAYLNAASLKIFGHGVVKSAQLISEREMIVELKKPVSTELKEGDALENITWTPALTIRNSRFEVAISRGTLVTTRRKVVIENNVYYRTGMHAILIENDASGWYESGPVTDVTIQNNQFIECGYNSFPGNYIISVNPHMQQPVSGHYVHKNIKIMNNKFVVYDYPLLSARNTDGLIFSGNSIEWSGFMPKGKERPAFYFNTCTGVRIKDNIFHSPIMPGIKLEHMIGKDIVADLKQ